MAGVEADAQPVRVGALGQDGGKLLETPADRGARPGRGLQQAADRQGRGLAVDFIEGRDDPRHSGRFAAAGISAGMGDDVGDAQRRGPQEFLHHGVERFSPQRVVGAGQVDEVGIMGQRMADARLLQRGLEPGGLFHGDGLASPLAGILGEQLDAIAAQRMRRFHRLIISAGNRLMGTEDGHPSTIPARGGFGYTIVMADAFAPRRRWLLPTPDRAVLGMLAVEAFLLLSEWFQWFAFNHHKGYAVLIAVASVGVFFVLMFLWFLAALAFRWRFQFSILSLLVLTLVVAVPFSWLATEMKTARKQREAVERSWRPVGA